MEINILAFGQIAEITGQLSWKLSDINDTDNLTEELLKKYSQLSSVKFSIAVNKVMIQSNTELKDNDTVALLPPFSGG